MNLREMDCVTMSYLAGVILISLGLFVALTRQFSLRSGRTLGRHGHIRLGHNDEQYNHIPAAQLDGWDAVLLGILMIALGVYLLFSPGPLLAAFKVCTVAVP
jgi:uncharacterized membrane protein HdeD (DUF308 family)